MTVPKKAFLLFLPFLFQMLRDNHLPLLDLILRRMVINVSKVIQCEAYGSCLLYVMISERLVPFDVLLMVLTDRPIVCF